MPPSFAPARRVQFPRHSHVGEGGNFLGGQAHYASHFYLAQAPVEARFVDVSLDIDKVQRSGFVKLMFLRPAIALFGALAMLLGSGRTRLQTAGIDAIGGIAEQSSRYVQRLQWGARSAALLAAASLPFSTAATNIFMMLAVLCWALSGQWRATARAIASEPAAWMGWLLFGALAAGIAWSRAPAFDALDALSKYRELALFGIVMFLFTDGRWRARLFGALFASGVALLVASYAVHFGLLPSPKPALFAEQGAVLWKKSITHSFLMSLLAFAASSLALRIRGWQRWAMAAIAVLAAANVLIAVQGRTGYVVLALLAVWLAVSRRSVRGLAAVALALAIAMSAAYRWAPTFQTRIDETAMEAQDRPDKSSVAQRLGFWKHSVQWSLAHPLLGAGTGAWLEAFYESTAKDDPFFHDRVHKHPHNEYLHLSVQLGVGGLALLIALFAVAFHRAGALPRDELLFARGVVLAFAIGCLFNDFLWDTTEGHLWTLLGGALFGSALRPAYYIRYRAAA
jgi:O-antigen ligase